MRDEKKINILFAFFKTGGTKKAAPQEAEKFFFPFGPSALRPFGPSALRPFGPSDENIFY